MNTENILVVEDDPVVSKVLESLLTAEGYEVVCAHNAATALGATNARAPDLMILDIGLVDDDPFNSLPDGYAVLHWLRNCLPDTDFPVIIHTGDTSSNVETQTFACRVHAIFRKGEDLSKLLLSVREALDARQIRKTA